MRLSCVCMHKKCFFFQIRSIEKLVTFLEMVIKIVFITKCNEKNCLKCSTLWKKLSASPKNGNPSPPKKNGQSLKKQFIRSAITITLVEYHIDFHTFCFLL